MAHITVAQACQRILNITNSVVLHTKDIPGTLAPDELQKQVADLALAVNRLCGIVSRMSKGDKDAGVPF
jgi:hypothetical protein